MIVTIVEEKYIPAVFEQVRELLQKPIDRGLGEYTIDQIRDLVISGRQQLWVGLDPDTDKFTGAVPHTLKSWFDPSVDALEEFGRLNGANHLIFYGRRGWRKLYEKRGYREYYVAMSKELKND